MRTSGLPEDVGGEGNLYSQRLSHFACSQGFHVHFNYRFFPTLRKFTAPSVNFLAEHQGGDLPEAPPPPSILGASLVELCRGVDFAEMSTG